MTTWQSDFFEVAGTAVQDCGTSTDFWSQGSSPTYWWETDGGGHLVGGLSGAVMYDYIYHVATSADQSIRLKVSRETNLSKIPQIIFRTDLTAASSDLTWTTPGVVVRYNSGAWKISRYGAALAQVSDPDYADGTDDPDGDEVRVLEASFVGTTATIAVHKGGGTLVGTATAEETTTTAAGNLGVLLNGSYSDTTNLAKFCSIDLLEAVDGVGGETAAAILKVRQGGAWVSGTLKVRQGGAWVSGTLKVRSGGEWV